MVEELRRAGLVSDTRFCEMLVSARRTRGYGPLRIKNELQEKGVTGETIDQWLDPSGAGWVADARRVRQKKFGAGMPKTFGEKARQMRFLKYRGFTHDQIQRAFGGDEH